MPALNETQAAIWVVVSASALELDGLCAELVLRGRGCTAPTSAVSDNELACGRLNSNPVLQPVTLL